LALSAVDRVAADALALCAIAAPTGDEEERARAVAQRLAEAGAAPARDAAGNVIARFGPEGEPAAVVAAHLDTVFPAGTPLEPRRSAGALHGPGIGDDCLGLAALVHLAARLADGAAPVHPVVLAATVGEEGLGDLRGARALLQACACDAFVALEGHGRDTVQTAGIGSARFRARFTGPGGHSWGDRGAPSAVHALLAAGAEAIAAAGSAHINVGVVGGGTSVNTIAAEAVAEIDLRAGDDAGLEATRDRVVAALRAATPAAVELVIEPLGRRPVGVTPAGHPLVQAARAARRAAGLPPADENASSTDANAALGRGLPAICLGLTHGANAHRPDESVELAPLAAGLAAVEALVDALGRGLPQPD
jgi:acetylornithine deacetylase/succinyl-diaminopimelate desuccinylase-like protein